MGPFEFLKSRTKIAKWLGRILTAHGDFVPNLARDSLGNVVSESSGHWILISICFYIVLIPNIN